MPEQPFRPLSIPEIARRLGHRAALLDETADLLDELARRLEVGPGHTITLEIRAWAVELREIAARLVSIGEPLPDA